MAVSNWSYILVFELDRIDEDFIKELDEELVKKVEEVAKRRGISFSLDPVPYTILELVSPNLKKGIRRSKDVFQEEDSR